MFWSARLAREAEQAAEQEATTPEREAMDEEPLLQV